MLRSCSVLLFVSSILPAAVHAAETPLANAQAFEGNAVITGHLAATTRECEKGLDPHNPQVWLSVGPTLLYQVEVPLGGSYEFHVVPGKYELTATSSSGCLTRTQLSAAAKQVARQDLTLEPARKPANQEGK